MKTASAGADTPTMGEYVFRPWRRYGHDRVYVACDGTDLGYLDRATGTVHAPAQHEESVRAALVGKGLLDPPAPAQPADVEWSVTLPGDTATYRPGASAREMARAQRAAAPVRTVVAALLGVHTEERAWRVGAQGEEIVARRLAKLPPEWTVVHDLPIGERGANVDHVAVGPAGVFTLNTKNLGGKVWVGGDTFLANGQRTDYVRKSRYEARRVATVLQRATGAPVPVQGVLVVRAPDLVVKEQPRDVAVVGSRTVARWLARRPAAVAPADVERVIRAVRDPRTWG